MTLADRILALELWATQMEERASSLKAEAQALEASRRALLGDLVKALDGLGPATVTVLRPAEASTPLAVRCDASVRLASNGERVRCELPSGHKSRHVAGGYEWPYSSVIHSQP